MNLLVARWRHYVERERLQPDLSRALRCVIGLMGPMLAAQWWELPIEVSFAAIAAQNIALVDVRGSYPLRLSLLLAMTLVLAGSGWLGATCAASVPLALGGVLLLMLAGGIWRHLSSDYGPSLAIASSLLFLIALAHPSGEIMANRHFLAALAGGIWGVLVQGALWPFRAQHPLRRAVADSWLALSDLVEAIAPKAASSPAARQRLIAERQALLRAALDHGTSTLTRVPTKRPRPYLKQLDDLNLLAARLSTRLLAVNASLETVMERPNFADLAPAFDPLFASLTNSARTIALTIVSRQPSHFASCEVRLRRLGNLLEALQDRVLSQTQNAPDGAQLAFILGQIDALITPARDALRATTERADEHVAFSVELFDLNTWTLRPLASALNLQWRPDPALVRFVARATVLQLIGVGIFTYFNLERGYWLPLTTMVVLQPDYGSTRMRAGQRVIGTLAGSVLASALLWLLLPPGALLAAMAITMAGFAFWLKRNYAIAVFFITLFVVLITEVSSHVTLAFTAERIIATAAGGVLALIAAQLFWPIWERSVFPKILAQALLANREYVRLLGSRLAMGGAYDAGVIAAKRAVEIANSSVFSSLQRMSADPKNQRAGQEEAAALANGNQRLTRALTVVALHLTDGAPLVRSEVAQFITSAMETLDALAVATQTGQQDETRVTALRTALDRLALPAPPAAAPALEQCVYGQFNRCATELSAMLLAAQASHQESTPPFPHARITATTPAQG